MLHMYIYMTPQKVLLSHCESRKCKENRQSPDGLSPRSPPKASSPCHLCHQGLGFKQEIHFGMCGSDGWGVPGVVPLFFSFYTVS